MIIVTRSVLRASFLHLHGSHLARYNVLLNFLEGQSLLSILSRYDLLLKLVEFLLSELELL